MQWGVRKPVLPAAQSKRPLAFPLRIGRRKVVFMKNATKVWLWIALILSLGTTILNGMEARWPSVMIAIGAMVGLCLLLFRGQKLGFQLMCICYVISCVVGIFSGIAGGTNPVLAVLMSLIGSCLIPGVTALFLRGQWQALR